MKCQLSSHLFFHMRCLIVPVQMQKLILVLGESQGLSERQKEVRKRNCMSLHESWSFTRSRWGYRIRKHLSTHTWMNSVRINWAPKSITLRRSTAGAKHSPSDVPFVFCWFLGAVFLYGLCLMCWVFPVCIIFFSCPPKLNFLTCWLYRLKFSWSIWVCCWQNNNSYCISQYHSIVLIFHNGFSAASNFPQNKTNYLASGISSCHNNLILKCQ